jgi:hypothetical protein
MMKDEGGALEFKRDVKAVKPRQPEAAAENQS